MVLTPLDDAVEFSRHIDEMFRQARDEVNAQVAKSLRRRAHASVWATQKQQDLQQVLEESQVILERLQRESAIAVNAAVSQAYGVGVSSAINDLTVGLRGVIPPSRVQAIARIARDIQAAHAGGISQILRRLPDVYQSVIAGTVSNMSLGVFTRRQATQVAVDRFAAQGVTNFVDRSGRVWDLGTYSEMATRTGMAHAATQGHTDTLLANDHNLVMVIPGPRVCPVCDDWVGKILSLDHNVPADVDVFATLDDARASGWGHPNCRCSIGAYIPGITELDPARPSDSGYEAGQQQRAIERNIRRWKDRAIMAQTPEARKKAEAKIREWQGRLNSHLERHPDLKRLRYRESSVRARGGPTPNVIQVDRASAGNTHQSMLDLSMGGDGAEYARRAIEDHQLYGADVLLARDVHGKVRGAMSLVDRPAEYDPESDTFVPPSKLINYTGSTLPGSNTAMLQEAMMSALDDNVSLYLEPTVGSKDYWVRQGAVLDPDGVGIEYYGFSREMMMRMFGLL